MSGHALVADRGYPIGAGGSERRMLAPQYGIGADRQLRRPAAAAPPVEDPIGPVFLVALVVATALGVIGALRARGRSQRAGRRRRKGGAAARQWPPFKQCPLCGTVLAQGEQVRTARYPERDGKAPVQVSGCSHCLGPGADTARRCPVCRQSLGAEDYLHGTMWRQSEHSGPRQPGQPAPFHVRIRGCTRCVGGARRSPASP